ncbi:MAG: ACT domain-containing protein [Chloroflexi bacterium]|nr:ACT domain-containing protein [Chloroflexota bacterium]
MASDRAVVTVIGEDRVGIVAGVSSVLAGHGVNIEDIRMATMGDLFTMIALVGLGSMTTDFATVKTALDEAGARLGVQAHIQRREIFDAMHRI